MLSVLLLALPVYAKTVTVQMKSISYEPKKLVVHAGDKVEWTNVSLTPHSATSESGAFDTGMIDPKKSSKAVEFKTPGTFPYHCSMHGKTMSAVVEVTP